MRRVIMTTDKDISVKYQNELNLVTLKNFNAKEMNLFFALCARMKDKGLVNILVTFEELKDLSDYKMTATKAFLKDLDNLYTKMLQLTYRQQLDDLGSYRKFVLFNSFEVNVPDKTVEVSINPKLEGILNGLTSEFSKFELSAFTSIRSTYAKTLFRLLIQYRSTGYYIVSIEKFRILLDIPAGYRMSEIDRIVIKPALRELENYFNTLKLSKIKAKKGNKIAKLEFSFNGLKNDLPTVSLDNWLNGE